MDKYAFHVIVFTEEYRYQHREEKIMGTCACDEYMEIAKTFFNKVSRINPAEIWQEISGESFEESIAFMLWVILFAEYDELLYAFWDLPKNSFTEVFAVHKLAEHFVDKNGFVDIEKMSAETKIPADKIKKYLGKEVVNYNFQAFHLFCMTKDRAEKYAYFLLWLKLKYRKQKEDVRFYMKKKNFYDMISFLYWVGTGVKHEELNEVVNAMPPSLCKTVGEQLLSDYF
jgi:hypothetical protein